MFDDLIAATAANADAEKSASDVISAIAAKVDEFYRSGEPLFNLRDALTDAAAALAAAIVSKPSKKTVN